MIPQSNATLTAVDEQSAKQEENWDDSGTDGPSVWSGSVRAYYREKRERIAGALVAQRGEDVLVERTLIVEEGVPAVVFATEQKVTFRIDGEGADTEGTVKDVVRARFAPAGPLQTTRLILESQ